MRLRPLLALCLAAGCGSSGGNAPDAGLDAAPDAPPQPALGALMPKVVGGAEVMATPKIMAITYANDPNRADFDMFVTQYAASAAWSAQVAEYGVGPLAAATPGHLTDTATATMTEATFLAALTAQLTGATPAWGAPDPHTIYAFSVPPGTSFDDGTGTKCCQDYYGYHYFTTINGTTVPYAINCACTGGGLNALQNLTVTAAHEATETATDPFYNGLGQADDEHLAWTYVTAGEVGDMCDWADTVNLTNPAGISYAIQRTWSNAAAAAGTDPCVPEPTASYYQSVPEAPDPAMVNAGGGLVTTHLSRIAKGASGQLTLHVHATPGAPGPFTVTVEDWNAVFGGPAFLTFTQPTGTFQDGATVTVPVNVVGFDSALGSAAAAYQVTTKPVTGPSTYFYGLVGK
jgi:hypothetical protein